MTQTLQNDREIIVKTHSIDVLENHDCKTIEVFLKFSDPTQNETRSLSIRCVKILVMSGGKSEID